jgi:tryptophan-rich sensory protein
MRASESRSSLPILIAAGAALLVAGVGGALTEIGPWYKALKQPWWKPPDWAFGPAWTLIFTLTAAAAVLAWHGAPDDAVKRTTLLLFGVNAILNMLWSALFFHLRRPDWALIEVVALWLSILALIVHARRRSITAAWLLVPYLLWVSFAACLNYAVVTLNGPFAGR